MHCEVDESEYYFWVSVVQKALHLLLMNFLKNLPNVGVIHPSRELTAVLRACVIKLSTAQLIHLRRMTATIPFRIDRLRRRGSLG